MLQIDYKSGVSICEQVVNGFIRLKALGVLKGGQQLPSVRALASQLAVNPNTVQKAYTVLETNGIIYSVKGKGSFLSDDEKAHNAVRENACESFRNAIHSAIELGLEKEELISLIEEEFTKGGNKHD